MIWLRNLVIHHVLQWLKLWDTLYEWVNTLVLALTRQTVVLVGIWKSDTRSIRLFFIWPNSAGVSSRLRHVKLMYYILIIVLVGESCDYKDENNCKHFYTFQYIHQNDSWSISILSEPRKSRHKLLSVPCIESMLNSYKTHPFGSVSPGSVSPHYWQQNG